MKILRKKKEETFTQEFVQMRSNKYTCFVSHSIHFSHIFVVSNSNN